MLADWLVARERVRADARAAAAGIATAWLADHAVMPDVAELAAELERATESVSA